jgi:hypothetical protein
MEKRRRSRESGKVRTAVLVGVARGSSKKDKDGSLFHGPIVQVGHLCETKKATIADTENEQDGR